MNEEIAKLALENLKISLDLIRIREEADLKRVEELGKIFQKILDIVTPIVAEFSKKEPEL